MSKTADFLEQMEVDYKLFINFANENDAFETANESAIITKKAELLMKKPRRNLRKTIKTVKGHLLNHIPNRPLDLFIATKPVKII